MSGLIKIKDLSRERTEEPHLHVPCCQYAKIVSGAKLWPEPFKKRVCNAVFQGQKKQT